MSACGTWQLNLITAVAIQLTPDDLREIGSAAAKITVHGERYPEHLQRRVNR